GQSPDGGAADRQVGAVGGGDGGLVSSALPVVVGSRHGRGTGERPAARGAGGRLERRRSDGDRLHPGTGTGGPLYEASLFPARHLSPGPVPPSLRAGGICTLDNWMGS